MSWKNESKRHSLASRGIKTSNHISVITKTTDIDKLLHTRILHGKRIQDTPCIKVTSRFGFKLEIKPHERDPLRPWVTIRDPDNRLLISKPIETYYVSYKDGYIREQFGDVREVYAIKRKPTWITINDILKRFQNYGFKKKIYNVKSYVK